MSNQVYANASTKYFTYPGFNFYGPPDDVMIPPATLSTSVFSSTRFEQQATITQVGDSLVFNDEGIYAITVNLGVFPDPITAAFGYSYALSVLTSNPSDARNGAIVVSIIQEYEITASLFRTIAVPGSFIGWFQNGDSLVSTFINKGNSTIVINDELTSLSIARIY